jgi:hypothetical protein
MYGNIHNRLHTIEVMQHEACTQPQDDEEMSCQGQVYDGMVLRIQAAYSDKRPWRDKKQWTLTPWNVDDREPLKDKDFTQRLFRKILADRGYISQDLLERLFIDDIHLVTKLKKNMRNSLMNQHDKIMLRKRALIETVNDELKNATLSIRGTAASTVLLPTRLLGLSHTTCFQRNRHSILTSLIK